LNLIIDIPQWRNEYLRVNTPPPKRNEELGIGRYIAWQTPIRRETVRRVQEGFK